MTKRHQETERQKRLRCAQRLVIKLGTSVVTATGGEVSIERVSSLVHSIAELKNSGRQIVLVSSGAVGLGAGRLGLHPSRLQGIAVRQACAAVGQNLLMHAYEQFFSVHSVKIAQVLLAEDDFTDFRRYTNLRRTMEKLLKLGVLPIVNENDTVATAELEYEKRAEPSNAEGVFGDNDLLAALVMSGLDADALVLLTNVDGLLFCDPKVGNRVTNDSHSAPIPLVEEITDELRAVAEGPSAGGRGGMLTKLRAAEIALQSGGFALIANGVVPAILDRIFAGEQLGTMFMSTSRMEGKRRWITYAADVRGRLIVNDGARNALLGGKASLLASGVIRVEQHFASRDVVSIADDDGREFARGIVNCKSEEALALIKCAESSSATLPGGDRSRVIVTRDNLVLSEQR
jgi:glutamate 5-kinase